MHLHSRILDLARRIEAEMLDVAPDDLDEPGDEPWRYQFDGAHNHGVIAEFMADGCTCTLTHAQGMAWEIHRFHGSVKDAITRTSLIMAAMFAEP